MDCKPWVGTRAARAGAVQAEGVQPAPRPADTCRVRLDRAGKDSEPHPAGQPLRVTTHVRPGAAPLTAVTLSYRVNYGPSQAAAMQAAAAAPGTG